MGEFTRRQKGSRNTSKINEDESTRIGEKREGGEGALTGGGVWGSQKKRERKTVYSEKGDEPYSRYRKSETRNCSMLNCEEKKNFGAEKVKHW